MMPEDLVRAQLYLDGELKGAQRESFLLQLEGDPDLKGHVEQLEKVAMLASNLELLKAADIRFTSQRPVPVGLSGLSRAWLSLPRHPVGSFLAGAVAAVACIVLGFGLASRVNKPPIPVETTSTFRMVYYSPSARSVSVLGDFNGWSSEIPLKSGQGGYWETQMRVPPGEYRYVFVVDGRNHVPDPTADYVIDDDFGSKNSVVRIGL
jgi:hypothetical protein